MVIMKLLERNFWQCFKPDTANSLVLRLLDLHVIFND